MEYVRSVLVYHYVILVAMIVTVAGYVLVLIDNENVLIELGCDLISYNGSGNACSDDKIRGFHDYA
jgi:hypothetical protein